MKIVTSVVDRESGTPLSYASVVLVDSNDEFIEGSGEMVQEDGTLELNSPLLDKEDVFIKISSNGYDTETFSPEELLEGPVRMWRKKETVLSDFRVTAIKKKKELDRKTGGYAVPIALAALAATSLSIWAYKTWA